MTQRSLAQKVELSQSYLSQLEDGRSTEPSVYVVQRLARIFGVSIEDLIGVHAPPIEGERGPELKHAAHLTVL
jgi:transcriptional regulator with XRE-family HTH domain